MTTKPYLILLLFIAPIFATAQCTLSDDYSDASLWTQVGEDVEVVNGQIEYQNGAVCSEQRRVYRDLGFTIEHDDAFVATATFRPTDWGQQGSSPSVGHYIISLTETTQEPLSDCPDIPCTGNPASTQNSVSALFMASNPASGSPWIEVMAHINGVELASSPILIDNLDTTYYVRLYDSPNFEFFVEVAWDADFTNQLAGSPASIGSSQIPTLTTVQHGCIARGASFRQMSGTVDDLCIYVIPPTGISEQLPAIDFTVAPNPARDELQVRFPTATQANVELVDLRGRTVIAEHVQANTATLNVSALSSGMYIARVRTTEGVATKKIVIE